MIELWREALRSLPSETFLDLIRTYLGPVRTPYRKHELMEELESFLKKKETIDRIVSLIDDGDAACLSAVIVLGSGDRDLVAQFMDGERAQALSRIVNLEERLLIFEAPAEGSGKRPLMINPLLAREIRRCAYDPALVFPPAGSGPASPLAPAAFPSLDRLDPAAVSAMVSFFLADDRVPRRKLDGELKIPAKAEREFETAFPPGWNCRDAAAFLEAARVFRYVDGKFCYQRFEAEAFFSDDMDTRSRLAALAAAIPEAAPLAKIAIRSIPKGIAFSSEAIQRFIVASPSASGGKERPSREAVRRLVSGMARAGLLERAPDGADGFILPKKAEQAATTPDSALIHIGADYHVMSGDRVQAPDLLFLAQCLDLTRLGAALEFNLNRRSAARAYRLGSGREATENRLARLSGGPLPQNLAYSLDAWEREHRSVNIASGILVFGDERLARFMEHSPAMKERVVEKIAPGAYLTDFESADECEKALLKSGMETPPRLVSTGLRPPAPLDIAQRGILFSGDEYVAGGEHAAESEFSEPFSHLEWGKRRENAPLDPEMILSELSERVKVSGFTKEAKEALCERIRLRLVIGTAGLRPDSVRYEKSEAAGLDYLGKVKLIEHSLRERSWLLDILFRNASGDPERRTVRPLSLHKAASGLLLECLAEEGSPPSGQSFKIPVDKISNVKRIRLSLFG